MVMRYLLFFLLGVSFSISLKAQNDSRETLISEMYFYSDAMNNSIDERNRKKAGDLFLQSFHSFIKSHNAFELTQEEMKTISILETQDNSFKLLSWQVKDKTTSSSYNAYVVFPDGSLTSLTPNGKFDANLEYMTLNKDQWYGALYYNLMPISDSEYLVFGYAENDKFTKIKVADVLKVENGNVELGKPLFEDKEDLGTFKNRIVLSYSSDAAVNLNFNPGLNMIVHDHLIQRIGRMEGQGPTYLPDGTYEGYSYEEGKWMYNEKLYDHSYGEDNAPFPKPVINKKKGVFGK